ncbi:MAG: hypothetical protein CL609_10865 [Anaerolineaceae bacterium]|nr:hypothetical protein [Anaerolineaceae bacterium]
MYKPHIYKIQIAGLISENWSDWFEGLTIQHTSEGKTILNGVLADQAALLGLLAKIHSLNLKIISVTREPTPTRLDSTEQD